MASSRISASKLSVFLVRELGLVLFDCSRTCDASFFTAVELVLSGAGIARIVAATSSAESVAVTR